MSFRLGPVHVSLFVVELCFSGCKKEWMEKALWVLHEKVFEITCFGQRLQAP